MASTTQVDSSLAAAARTAVLVSSDLSFRQRVRDTLTGLRWRVKEATGGAEALAHMEATPAEALILDSWLPDLEIREFVKEFERRYPRVDLISADGVEHTGSRGLARSPRRNELLHALRVGQDAGTAVSGPPSIAPASTSAMGRSTTYSVAASPLYVPGANGSALDAPGGKALTLPVSPVLGEQVVNQPLNQSAVLSGEPFSGISPTIADAVLARPEASSAFRAQLAHRLPEFVGESSCLLEVSRRIRLVAPRRTPVLIQGPTGTGKELVAKALHRLSPRSGRPFVVLNCAAIPESLLEAELFGHTRGAFTGAVQGRVGRIEAAHGGTLFLDEIGEMPLPLQAKLLRFVECGELQRIGENESVVVDARIVAATHQPLANQAAKGGFRSDLYYRLSVFMIRTPALIGHREDLPLLAAHFLARLGVDAPAKRLHPEAIERLMAHSWPGNVRELEHVIERGYILAEDRAEIGPREIEFGEGAEWETQQS